MIMKLHEIQTITPKDLKYKPVHQPIDKLHQEWSRARRREGHLLGAGAFGDVYGYDKDPGTAEKISNLERVKSLSRDAYYLYLDMLSHNERMQNNPFFPKVYSLKSWKDTHGRVMYDVKMEKLQPLNVLSSEQIITMGERYFTNFDNKFNTALKRKIQLKTYTRPRSDKPLSDLQKTMNENAFKYAAMQAVASCLDESIKGEVTTHIKDSLLRQAMVLIRGILIRKEGRLNDIHDNNIMVRLSPSGPQLVITDPVC
jgi:hypothetical protein